MDTSPQTPDRLRQSVIAVPPLARDAKERICGKENAKIIRHLETGGVNLLLYGGNAMLYHVQISEYASLLQMLDDACADGTGVVPSIGPTYGTMLDHVAVLRDFDFPTAMVLPQRDIADAVGIARGIRTAAERLGRPLVVYLKFDRWLPPELVRSLMDDGVISWIKYAVVRDDPAQDDYLREILQVVPQDRVVSGIGEQPAIIHMRDFGVVGFTSGCVCVAPTRSMELLQANQAGQWEAADRLRRRFEPLEDLRNAIHPIRVLHRAVELAGIARTGPMLPLLSELSKDQETQVEQAARELLQWQQQAEGVST